MILIAHEDELLGRSLAALLKFQAGWATSIVNDAEQILPFLQKEKPGLLLISDGFASFFSTVHAYSLQVMRAIHLEPALADLPTVMLCHGAEDAAKASALGCTPLIIPADPEEFFATVRTLVPALAAPTA